MAFLSVVIISCNPICCTTGVCKLGEVAWYRQLAWFHSAAGHAHWQGASGHWFESLAHQVLANSVTVHSDSETAGSQASQQTNQMPVLLHCHLLTSSQQQGLRLVLQAPGCQPA